METEQQVEVESEDNEYENDDDDFGGDVEVVVNNEIVNMVGSSFKRDHPRDLDAFVQALGSMNETTRSRQASMLTWVVRSGSTAS